MDKEYLNKLQAYMNQPEEQRDLMAGAVMLLQLNRNRVLHQTIIRRPEKHKERLFHELGKFLKIHADQMTLEGIMAMEKEVAVIKQTTFGQKNELTGEDEVISLGKRTDHDGLPESVKALWVENGDLARQMKSLHEKLKLMQNAKPCDRYDSLQRLVETDRKYRQNWEKYDKYVPDPANETKGQNLTGTDTSGQPVIDAKRISANRKYFSLNKGKLAAHKEKGDLVKYHELLEKIQERYDELIQADQTMDEKQLKELIELGLKV